MVINTKGSVEKGHVIGVERGAVDRVNRLIALAGVRIASIVLIKGKVEENV